VSGRIIISIFVLLGCWAIAVAQICPPADPGYVRQPRPQGAPANYPPSAELACFPRGTNEAANYVSCYLCHDYLRRTAA
jgi:hypothetical protein